MHPSRNYHASSNTGIPKEVHPIQSTFDLCDIRVVIGRSKDFDNPAIGHGRIVPGVKVRVIRRSTVIVLTEGDDGNLVSDFPLQFRLD